MLQHLEGRSVVCAPPHERYPQPIRFENSRMYLKASKHLQFLSIATQSLEIFVRTGRQLEIYTGQIFSPALREAAERGIKVTVVADSSLEGRAQVLKDLVDNDCITLQFKDTKKDAEVGLLPDKVGYAIADNTHVWLEEKPNDDSILGDWNLDKDPQMGYIRAHFESLRR